MTQRKKSWSLALLGDNKYALLGDNWFNEERTKCQWPTENSFARYKVTKNCSEPVDSWEWYDVKKVCVSGIVDFKEAEKLLNEYESTASESDSKKSNKKQKNLSMPCFQPTGDPKNSNSTPYDEQLPELVKSPSVPAPDSGVLNSANPSANLTVPEKLITSNPSTSTEKITTSSPSTLMENMLNIASPPSTPVTQNQAMPLVECGKEKHSAGLGRISKRSLNDALEGIMASQQNILQKLASDKAKKKKSRKERKRKALSFCPLQTEEDCDNFDSRLANETKFRRQTRQELVDLGGKDPRSTAQQMLNRLMSDDAVKLYSWKGQKPSPEIPAKKSFKKSMFASEILNALRKMFPKPRHNITEMDLQDYLQDWIIQAKFRQKKRQKRSSDLNKSNQEPVQNKSNQEPAQNKSNQEPAQKQTTSSPQTINNGLDVLQPSVSGVSATNSSNSDSSNTNSATASDHDGDNSADSESSGADSSDSDY